MCRDFRGSVKGRRNGKQNSNNRHVARHVPIQERRRFDSEFDALRDELVAALESNMREVDDALAEHKREVAERIVACERRLLEDIYEWDVRLALQRGHAE